ncbi:ABC transporter permease [Limosilactobacillus sp.]|jgi:osmoprotectant transport system permease protein|uniref:ABC transporter permease n=1 Tax=Limosilactobacillus sp. TaxID=2773925 RepID=UPI0025B7C072|nr:ABC transporter permease [Limosilactobacillus sp.]MCH3921670.1 ABC transporter permease [Limosilactobacillus sp.]MCH3928441.1 ABC transporter permease [Limosilactobacillus sp.]
MIKYWQENAPQMLLEVEQHAAMVLSALAIALLITILLVLFFLRRQRWLNGLVYFFSLLYSIPSFAFFALLLPLSGLGMWTAVIVLTVYSEYILLRSFITGIRGVDSDLVEVARGLGMTNWQVIARVQLPLALPAIFSGIQVALASTMAMATIAATINAGGLGQLLFDGLQSLRVVPILWGILLTMVLTLLCAGAIWLLQWALTRRWAKMVRI